MTVLPHFSPPGGSFGALLKRGALVLPVSLGIALAGCAGAKNPKIDAGTTGSLAARPMTNADFEEAVTYWGGRYQAGIRDKEVALNYAAALRRTGRSSQAVAVLQKAVINFPEDREVLAAYGKALAAAGDLQRAVSAIQRAQTPDKPDWRLLSAEAAILDQIGQYDRARQLYRQALDIAPDEPTVLSNYGMSHVLTAELDKAERLLRKAIKMPGADSRVRQNLALVVGLSGRFEEAKEIAAAELSPQQAAENIAYLKQMLAEQNNWQRLSGDAASAG